MIGSRAQQDWQSLSTYLSKTFTVKYTRDFLVTFGRILWLLTPLWTGLALIISAGGLLLARIQHLPWSDGLYLAWITALTVGYGDLTPKTGLARLLCVALALVGVIFTAIITSLALNAGRVALERHQGIKDRMSRMDEL